MVAGVFALFAMVLSRQTDYRGTRTVAFRNLDELNLASSIDGKRTYTKTISTALSWDELVPSWNVALPEKSIIAVYARPVYPDKVTKFYCLGRWQPGKARKSITGQKDEHGNVLTDTLVLKHPAAEAEV